MLPRAGALIPLTAVLLLAAPDARAGAAQRGLGKAPRPSLRIRSAAKIRRGAVRRTEYLAERRWNDHPGVRRAMSAFLGAEGRRLRASEFDVRAVYAGKSLVGYEVHAVSNRYDGTFYEQVLDVDLEGNLTGQKAHPKAGQNAGLRALSNVRPGRRGAKLVRKAKIAAVLRQLPGGGTVARFRNNIKAQKRTLVDEYERVNGVTAELEDQAADRHVADVADYSQHEDSWVFGVSDLHANTGVDNPNEDFRAGGKAMVRFLEKINDGGKRRATMVCGGDCFEFMENAPADATDDELKAFATRFVEGHADTYRALTRAVVPNIPGQPDRGLRVLFVRGNHDIQMITKRIRAHVIDEIARVGGLKGRDLALFKERVAFTGDMAVLGKKGEWVMIHGDVADPANNWRENSNAFRYRFSRGGLWNIVKTMVTKWKLPALRIQRVREANMGYVIVQKFFKFLERKDPTAENTKGSAHAVGFKVLTQPKNIVRLARVLWALLGKQKRIDGDTLEKMRQNDYSVALAWARRTQVHKQWGLASPEEVVARMDSIVAQMPKPVHERMTSPLRTVNLIRVLLGEGRRIAREREHAEPLLIELYSRILPNVIDINVGHTHDQARVEGYVAGRGKVVYRNTGTWTTTKGQDVFTVSVSRHENGVLAEKGLFRADPASGSLISQLKPPAPEWTRPDNWSDTAPRVTQSGRPTTAGRSSRQIPTSDLPGQQQAL